MEPTAADARDQVDDHPGQKLIPRFGNFPTNLAHRLAMVPPQKTVRLYYCPQINQFLSLYIENQITYLQIQYAVSRLGADDSRVGLIKRVVSMVASYQRD